MMARAENINPAILVWARETAGLTLLEAAERLGLSSSVRGTAEEKLVALESGDVKPTRSQLLKIATVYRRPLTSFYRSRPPVVAERGEDFRTIAGDVSREEAALLDALLRDIRARQDMVRAILEDDEDVRRLAFVGSMTIREPVVTAARRIKETLGIEDDQGFRRGLNSYDELFGALRARVEGIGVFVLLAGNLGSHHTNISERVFRGFAVADDIAPFIVINDQDAVTARSFTLIHELAHIFVGSTGVSGAPSTVDPSTPLARVERFCNDVAGEFLLPEASLAAFVRIDGVEQAQSVIADIAASRNVSEAMVAYRFWRTGRIDAADYRELVAMYASRWSQFRERRREQARESESSSGPSYYTVRKHRLGSALVNLIGRTLRANEMTHTKAAKVLGVKPSNVEPLLRGVEAISGSFSPERG
jgi:Zn-dependent peptidase ImmA (M78 family)